MIIMNQQFVDREEDLAYLEDKYREQGAQLIVVYGRRRIGKTELLLRFARGKRYIYFLAEKTRMERNIAKMAERMAEYLGRRSFARIAFSDWEDLFREFLEWKGGERVVIIIDEFPYLVELDRGIVSLFQRIWDTLLSRRGDVYLVLCGSSVGVMETEVLGYRSPLYGRRTGQWRVRELDIPYIRCFAPRYTFEELLMLYGALGGVPAYLRLVDPQASPLENIERLMLRRGALLYEEAENLLRQELREPRNYKLILEAIAEGRRRVSEIASSTGLDRAAVSRYLDTLLLLGIVSYETPVLARPKARRRLYYIADNYFRFWFRYVHPNKDLVEADTGHVVLEEVERSYSEYMGPVFEHIAKRFLLEAAPFKPERIGRHWWRTRRGEARELDVLAYRDGRYLLGEVKWSRLGPRDVERIYRRLRGYAEELGLRDAAYAVVAREISRKEEARRPGLLLYDLGDLEEHYSPRRHPCAPGKGISRGTA